MLNPKAYLEYQKQEEIFHSIYHVFFVFFNRREQKKTFNSLNPFHHLFPIACFVLFAISISQTPFPIPCPLFHILITFFQLYLCVCPSQNFLTYLSMSIFVRLLVLIFFWLFVFLSFKLLHICMSLSKFLRLCLCIIGFYNFLRW